MNDVKTFADIFKVFADDFRKDIRAGKAKNPAKIDLEVGRRVLGSISPLMAVESISNQVSTGMGLAKYVMAIESANNDITRLGGISYSMALKHQDVIGISVNPENFTTHVSKKNYDIVTENLKAFALVGLSAIIVAGLGYLVWKLIHANKSKVKNAGDVVALNKDVEKAAKLFSSIDLSGLSEPARKAYLEAIKGNLNVMVANGVNESKLMTNGYSAMVASVGYDASLNQLEAHRFASTENSWLVHAFNSVAEQMTNHVTGMIDVLEKVEDANFDVAAIDASALNTRVANTSSELLTKLGNWGRLNGVNPDNNGEVYVSDLEDTKYGRGGATQECRLLPEELMVRIDKESDVPNPSTYVQYNKLLDAMSTKGKKLDDALQALGKRKLGEEAINFLNEVVEDFKVLLNQLDTLGQLVRSEADALATTYSYRSIAAKKYSEAIFEALKVEDDKDVVKAIKDQIAKAAKELPRKRIALESYNENDNTMALEGFGSNFLKIAGAVAIVGLVGAGIVALVKVLASKGTNAEKKAETISNKTQSVLENFLSGGGLAVSDHYAKKYLSDVAKPIPRGVADIISDNRKKLNPIHGVQRLPADFQKEVLNIEKMVKSFNERLNNSLDHLPDDSVEIAVRAQSTYGLDSMQFGGAGVISALMIKNLTYATIVDTEGEEVYNKMDRAEGKDRLVIISMKNKVLNLTDSLIEHLTYEKNPKDVKFNVSKDMLKQTNIKTNEIAQQVAEIDKDIRPRLEKLLKTKFDEDRHERYRNADRNYARSVDLLKAIVDFISTCKLCWLRLVELNFKQTNQALNLILAMQDYEKNGGRNMATESIDWDDSGFNLASGDGIDIDVQESQAYLDLPEYAQAGYRFDPREGYEGSSVMAMESWSNGARIAVGIAAAVGIIGLGALIASTLMKRSGASPEKHATKDHLEMAKTAWKKLEGETGTIYEQIGDVEDIVDANAAYKTSNPQWYDRIAAIKNRIEKARKLEVDVNGQSVRIGRAILDDIGEGATSKAAKLAEFNRSRLPESMLDVDHQRFPKALSVLFENLISKPIQALESGRPAEVVLEELDKWLESKGNASRDSITTGDWADPEFVIAQVDGNWLPQALTNNNSVEIISNPIEFLTMATSGHNHLLELNERIGRELEKYVIDERLIARFNKVQQDSQGSRDAAASILRRIEQFRGPFATFVRALRRDQENIEAYLTFIDRYIKSMSRYGKSITDELKDIRRELDHLATAAAPDQL